MIDGPKEQEHFADTKRKEAFKYMRAWWRTMLSAAPDEREGSSK